MIRRQRKAVSPLIAAVLLIAFTMAIAAILTAWVTTFTKEKKASSEEYMEKMKCAGANFKADPTFVSYNRDSDFYLRAKLENIGFEPVIISKATVTFMGQSTPFDLNVTKAIGDLDMRTIDKEIRKNFVVNVTAIDENEDTGGLTLADIEAMDLDRIKFETSCDGVWAELRRPTAGWKT